MRNHFDDLLDSFGEAIAISDQHGTMLHVNRKHEELTGFMHQDILGKSVLELVEHGVFDEEDARVIVDALHAPHVVGSRVIRGLTVAAGDDRLDHAVLFQILHDLGNDLGLHAARVDALEHALEHAAVGESVDGRLRIGVNDLHSWLLVWRKKKIC
ncbi:PAS domain S-box protein [Desulfocurvus sp. DL9XJH121]